MTVNHEPEWNSAVFKIPKVEMLKSSSSQIFVLNVKENSIIKIFRNMPQLSIYPHRKLMKDKNTILVLDFGHIPLKMKGQRKEPHIQNPNEIVSNFLSADLERVTLRDNTIIIYNNNIITIIFPLRG